MTRVERRKLNCLSMFLVAGTTYWLSLSAWAAMSADQMKALRGAAQLDLTVDRLLRKCGLPAAILDPAAATSPRQRLRWQGTDMHLSALDWEIVYTSQPRAFKNARGWINRADAPGPCLSGASQLQLTAKGHVGVLTVTKKPDGSGYVTKYTEPQSHYQSHKVIAAQTSLAKGLAVSALTRRYGQPDELVKQPGKRERYRYWVLTLRESRPETLHAVDFEIDGGISHAYTISSGGVDFVQLQLEKLLRKWERDYVMD